MIARYQHATRAITGTRDRQEDACAFAFPDARALYFTASGRVTGTGELLAVLADGMGGHVAGAEASRDPDVGAASRGHEATARRGRCRLPHGGPPMRIRIQYCSV